MTEWGLFLEEFERKLNTLNKELKRIADTLEKIEQHGITTYHEA